MQGPWSRRRFLATTGGAVFGAGLLAACGDDDDPSARSVPSNTTTSTPTDLPTNDEEQLTAMFAPRLEPVGQRVTRIGLYDLSEGFVRDDEGTHLAIYTEPLDPAGAGWDTERYIRGCVEGMQACTPFTFDTWAGLETMDLCQEPPQEEAPEPEPPIVTQVQLARSDYVAVDDWDALTLVDLMAARERSPSTVTIRSNEAVREHPGWVGAQTTARETAGG